MFNILIILLCSVVSGVLYRMGGASGWNTKFRDFGVPTCFIIALLFSGIINSYNFTNILSLMVAWGLLFASLTTYWKKKGESAKWWNWLITGLIYGFAALPLIWIGIPWYDVVLRTIVLGAIITLWSEKINNAVWEEVGRGVAIILTLLLIRRKK